MITSTILKDLPNGTELLENQVAGHTFQIGTDEIGMLKDQHDGSVLKAAVKPICGVREIQFYEQLQKNQTDPNMVILHKLVPEYRGTVKIPFRGKIIDFIKLTDLTHAMTQPCVIDIKIGKRTWDPCASSEKMLAEEQKYQACKQNLGFCIPGFQVYDIKSGRIKRFGKDYGKKLDQTTVKAALKIFLNAESGLCRSLLLQLLATLHTIQSWACSQTSLRLYSSSLLMVYDAKRLKNEFLCTRRKGNSLATSPNGSLSPSPSANSTIKLTPTSINGNESSSETNELSAEVATATTGNRLIGDESSNGDDDGMGRCYNNSLATSPNGSLSQSPSANSTIKLTPTSINGNESSSETNELSADVATATTGNRLIGDESSNGDDDGMGRCYNNSGKSSLVSSESIQLYKKLQRNHSAQINYEEDMKNIRTNYALYLDQLIDGYNDSSINSSKEWAFVKIIDFAHVFPAEEAESIDTNYLFGIENLVNIFEEFLSECDDQ